MSTPAAHDVVAAELVAARREGRGLTGFPGVVPASMAEAYQIQELASRDGRTRSSAGRLATSPRTGARPVIRTGWSGQFGVSNITLARSTSPQSRSVSSRPGSRPWKQSWSFG
jgi:hypothetical protein